MKMRASAVILAALATLAACSRESSQASATEPEVVVVKVDGMMKAEGGRT